MCGVNVYDGIDVNPANRPNITVVLAHVAERLRARTINERNETLNRMNTGNDTNESPSRCRTKAML